MTFSLVSRASLKRCTGDSMRPWHGPGARARLRGTVKRCRQARSKTAAAQQHQRIVEISLGSGSTFSDMLRNRSVSAAPADLGHLEKVRRRLLLLILDVLIPFKSCFRSWSSPNHLKRREAARWCFRTKPSSARHGTGHPQASIQPEKVPWNVAWDERNKHPHTCCWGGAQGFPAVDPKPHCSTQGNQQSMSGSACRCDSACRAEAITGYCYGARGFPAVNPNPRSSKLAGRPGQHAYRWSNSAKPEPTTSEPLEETLSRHTGWQASTPVFHSWMTEQPRGTQEKPVAKWLTQASPDASHGISSGVEVTRCPRRAWHHSAMNAG